MKITKNVCLAVILGDRPGAVTQVGINGVEIFQERWRETLGCYSQQTSSANHSFECLSLIIFCAQSEASIYSAAFVIFLYEANLRQAIVNESCNWFVQSSIPGAPSYVLENFGRLLYLPEWPPLVSEDVLQCAACLDPTMLVYFQKQPHRPIYKWPKAGAGWIYCYRNWKPIDARNLVSYDVRTVVETLRRGRGDSSREGWGVPHMNLAFLTPPVTLSLFLNHIPIVTALSRNNFS